MSKYYTKPELSNLRRATTPAQYQKHRYHRPSIAAPSPPLLQQQQQPQQQRPQHAHPHNASWQRQWIQWITTQRRVFLALSLCLMFGFLPLHRRYYSQESENNNGVTRYMSNVYGDEPQVIAVKVVERRIKRQYIHHNKYHHNIANLTKTSTTTTTTTKPLQISSPSSTVKHQQIAQLKQRQQEAQPTQMQQKEQQQQLRSSSSSSRSNRNSNSLTVSSLFGIDRVDWSKRLEFVHITKTGGSAIEMGAAASGVQWGACHYVQLPHLGCNMTADWAFPIGINMPQHLANKTHSEPWHSPPHWLVPNPIMSTITTADVNNNNTTDHRLFATFLVVRDPYQRILSEYYCSAFGYNGTLTSHSLNDWIVRKLTEDTPYYGHLLPQHYYVFHHITGEMLIDHVLRYETLEKEFHLLMKLYHLNIRLPQKQAFVMSIEQSVSRLTVGDLTHDTLRLINDYYRLDFESFGYGMIVTD